MFDMEQSLRQWRQELEATLAFSNEEIDELEDHLRFSIDAKLKEAFTHEDAWTHSLGGLGSASALAPEFAKDKLLPALGRLIIAWWRPALLLFLFGLTFAFSVQKKYQGYADGTSTSAPWVAEPKLWGMTWVCLIATLILLSDTMKKNAVLASVGNAFCLIPLLHVLVYNALTEKIIGAGWNQMAASFGWFPVSLSSIGLVVLNVWWWKRNFANEKFPALLAVAGMLVLLLTLSPFVGELIGNLSIREVYQMPTASQLAFTGEVRDEFLKWKFVDVLINCVMYITNILPFGFVLLICMGICVIHGFVRGKALKNTCGDGAFPSLSALPWFMTLLGSSLSWVLGHFLEPPFSEQVRQMEKSGSHGAVYGGLEIIVLFSALLFFVCAWELTKQLARASCVRPFYAALLVVIELAVALALPVFLALFEMLAINPTPRPSAQPGWLSWVLGIAIVGLACCQSYLIAKKLRSQAGQISLWKFEGRNLVELGLSLGLAFAGSGLILYMVAIVMAFESVTGIQAMIAWGQSIKYPVANHFYPRMYGTPDHLAFWVASGIAYLSLCLSTGLGAIIVLSGLEFIRFNSFRLYKVKKLRQESAQTLALNE